MKPFEFIYESILEEAQYNQPFIFVDPITGEKHDISSERSWVDKVQRPYRRKYGVEIPSFKNATVGRKIKNSDMYKFTFKPEISQQIVKAVNTAKSNTNKDNAVSNQQAEPASQQSVAAKLNPKNLPYIFIDPITKEKYSVTDMNNWNENFVDEYNEMYDLNIPRYPNYAPTTTAYHDRIELQLAPQYVTQMKDFLADKSATKDKASVISKSNDRVDTSNSVENFIDTYNVKGLKAKSFGTKSVLSDKTKQFNQGSGNANTLMKNDDGDHLTFQSYFTIPMINDYEHQIVNNNPLGVKLKQNLFSVFTHPDTNEVEKDIIARASTLKEAANKKIILPIYGEPQVQAFASKSQNKISYDKTTLNIGEVVRGIDSVVAKTFSGKNLLTDERTGLNVWWSNPENMNSATEVALIYITIIPSGEDPKSKTPNLDDYSHYVVGWFDNNGIPVQITKEKELFKKFNINAISQTIPGDYKGTGAGPEKAASGAKPNNVLGMSETPQDMTSQDALGAEYEGLTFSRPFTEIPARISMTFANDKVKKDKLLEVFEKTVGSSSAASVSFPVKIDNLLPNKTGLTVSSISTDFAEVLHPLACMKKNGVIDNGVLDAAETYLGTRDMSQCKVFFGNENTPVFDSLIIAPDGKQLMISSKKGAGMAAGYAGFGNAFRSLQLAVQNTPNKEVKTKFNEYMLKGYGTLAEFIGLQKENDKETKEHARQLASRMTGWPKEVADKIIEFKSLPKASQLKNKVAQELISTKYLNNTDFIQFCYFVLSSTNLVQINTQFTEKKEKGDLTLDSFIATWPNEMFDKVYFLYEEKPSKVLKFKIEVGGKTIDTEVGGEDYSSAQGRAPSTSKQTGERYADAAKFSGKKIPGTKQLERWDFNDRNGDFKDVSEKDGDIPWYMGVKDLYKNYTKILNTIPNKILQKVTAKRILKPLYDNMMKLQQSIGHDAARYSGVPMTTNQLLTRVQQLINGN